VQHHVAPPRAASGEPREPTRRSRRRRQVQVRVRGRAGAGAASADYASALILCITLRRTSDHHLGLRLRGEARCTTVPPGFGSLGLHGARRRSSRMQKSSHQSPRPLFASQLYARTGTAAASELATISAADHQQLATMIRSGIGGQSLVTAEFSTMIRFRFCCPILSTTSNSFPTRVRTKLSDAPLDVLKVVAAKYAVLAAYICLVPRPSRDGAAGAANWRRSTTTMGRGPSVGRVIHEAAAEHVSKCCFGSPDCATTIPCGAIFPDHIVRPETRVWFNKHRSASQATCPTIYKGNIAEREVSQCYEV
jgi:hypothetical protein